MSMCLLFVEILGFIPYLVQTEHLKCGNEWNVKRMMVVKGNSPND